MKKPIPFGKYLLLERINVGGMAEVFLGKAFGVEGFERLLAIKRILPTMVEDTEFITMFLDEARISVQLNHANVVQIYELGKHDDSYYIAMEYVTGKDLRHLLEYYRKNQQVMPTPQCVYVASKICEGLEYAHRKKDARGMELHIVHRDVSPQNILLSYDGEVKLIDFGIAKAANRAQKTQAGILKGKFGYMSPEQVRGLPVDHRSDVFAVGVILYEMLTGERLFVGESDFSTLEKVRNADVLPPRQYNSEIPVGLEKVVLKSLARDVEDRYQWCSDMQEDLMRYLLSGDTIYSSKHLAGFMREAFADDQSREQERLERYATVERPDQVEVSGVTASSGPPARPALAPEPPPEPTPAPAPPPKRRPTRAPAPAVQVAAAAEQPDPYNPIIPPPEPGEFDDEPPADRTEIFKPSFKEAKPAPQARRSGRSPAPALGDDHEPTLTPVAPTAAKKSPPKGTVNMRGAVAEDEVPPEGDGEEEPEVAKTVIGMPAPRSNGHQRSNRGLLEEEPAATDEPEEAEAEAEEEQAAPDDGPSTVPPDGMEEELEPAPRRHGEEEEEAPADDPNATMLRPPPPVAPRRQTKQVPKRTPTRQQAVAPPRLSGQRPAARGPIVDKGPPVIGAKKKVGSKLPLILASAGAALLVLIVMAAVVLKPGGPGKLAVMVSGPPDGTEILVTIDKKVVKAGVDIPVAPGKHLVIVDVPGFKPVKQTVTIQSNVRTPIPIELEPEEPAPPETAKPPDKVAVDDTKPPKGDEKPPKVDDRNAPEKKPTTFDLHIESTPTGADIEINGKKLGKTPKVLPAMEPGKVKSVTVSLKGYNPDTQPVTWDGSQPEVSVFFSLEKAEKVAEAKPAEPKEPREPKEPKEPKKEPVKAVENKPKPAEPKEPKEPKKEPVKVAENKPTKQPAAAKGQGKLVTGSRPIAKVSIDGKDTGRWTPIPPAQPLEIPAGSHTITYVTQDGKKATRTVTITANETAKVTGVDDFQ